MEINTKALADSSAGAFLLQEGFIHPIIFITKLYAVITDPLYAEIATERVDELIAA